MVGSCLDPCGAIQFNLTIKPGETESCVLLLGLSEDTGNVAEKSAYYRQVGHAEKALEDVVAFWSEKLSIITVNTPDNAMNILLNGWLLYQVITCRIWARTAFYQAGGAYGFRDQLQDSLALLTVWPELARSQILKHAAHQFVEGDVLHWWHEPAEKGPRTRISDDYLWLAYVTAEYVRVTGDASILDEQVHFLSDAPLSLHEEERYSSPSVTDETASLYEHCLRAIDHGHNFGVHGLPLMAGGDWNDGMNMVGIEGKGESIWLGWFLLKTLKDFIPHVIKKGDLEIAQKYENTSKALAYSIDQYGWDGKWYKRAYFDDGSELGTDSRSECKIDAIAQAWSVISEAGDVDKVNKAMASVEAYLVNKEEGLIKLLTPPFDRSDMEPGYIKGYVPGVRENGGQYSHAAAWVIGAFAKMGDGDKAHELFELINPINHTNTYREMLTYKAEPYVMAADVYSVYPHVGRGGWTWYTGAAGWMYQTGIESILGFRREGNNVFSEPNLPHKWRDAKDMIQYKP
ncbi:MAG TPA: glycosyl transferase, partial [Clostridiales bacterium UBA8960]|nr:glycosyl transferase [Clostridiales bacterium UBA8960]